MEVFRNLYINLIDIPADKFIEEVASHLESNESEWHRDDDLEEHHVNLSLPEYRFVYYFVKKVKDSLYNQIRILLQKQTHYEFSVMNIVPNQTAKLSKKEYNDLLMEFYTKGLQPIIQKYDGTVVTLTEDTASIHDYMDEKSLQKFIDFSRTADKYIAFGHPRDRDLWNEFIIEAYKNSPKLNARIIERILIEEEDWPQDVAEEVASEFENYKLFLNQYDKYESTLATAEG